MDFQLIFAKDVRCLDFFWGGECPIHPEAFVEETTLSIELPLRLFQDELTIFVGHLFLSSLHSVLGPFMFPTVFIQHLLQG